MTELNCRASRSVVTSCAQSHSFVTIPGDVALRDEVGCVARKSLLTPERLHS
jgi:hypothetical protein